MHFQGPPTVSEGTPAAQRRRVARSTCVPQYIIRYVRHTRGWYAYPVRHAVRTVRGASGQADHCVSGTYGTQEAGTRSPYVQYDGTEEALGRTRQHSS